MTKAVAAGCYVLNSVCNKDRNTAGEWGIIVESSSPIDIYIYRALEGLKACNFHLFGLVSCYQ